MTIRIKLVACISLLIAIICGVSAFSFYAMESEAKLAETIVADRVAPMEHLKIISDGYAVSIVDTVHKVRSDALSFEEGEASVKAAIGRIEEHWQKYTATTLTAEEKSIVDDFKTLRTNADNGVAELQAILFARDKQALSVFADTKLYQTIDPLGGDIGKLMDLQIRVAKEAQAQGHHLKYTLLWIMGSLSLFAALVAAASIWTVLRSVVRPINAITDAMAALAGGNLDVSVFGEGRSDEIGRMASAVAVFRDNALERQKLEKDAAANRSLSERERADRERVQAQESAEVRLAVDSIGHALGQLSDGKLNYRIREAFAERLDQVRIDFNKAVAKLEEAIRRVGHNAQAIAAGSNQIRSAADDLSKRTEQQAASVEETAAALEEITTTVADSSRRADEAGRLVQSTRDYAERSGEVVGRAVDAMNEIESSSNEISNIIGVIDEIAFQTNLLALNAGVEAARAGEAGKGFAVVAQEVRELAQRSAQAAKEIKTLISKSGDQVRNGVELVSETGEALRQIVSQVQNVSTNVTAIVEGSKEQATGLKEINTAVNTMDQGTQQNAAMVEESTAASHSLAREADALFELVKQFTVGAENATASDEAKSMPMAVPSNAKPVPSPARQMASKLATAFTGKTALAANSWEEF